MMGFTRRTFLAVLVLLAPASRLGALRRQPRPAAVSLDEFLELSGRLLGRSKLDRDVAQVYLDALIADPDNAVLLATLVHSSGNPTPEQAVLSRTIIEWWYTGVYYAVDGKPRLATHTGALVWPALGMPAPGTCTGQFGAWSRPPLTSSSSAPEWRAAWSRPGWLARDSRS
jgi:hypothetical protein